MLRRRKEPMGKKSIAMTLMRDLQGSAEQKLAMQSYRRRIIFEFQCTISIDVAYLFPGGCATRTNS